MNVSATYVFTATHAVADDPELATPHARRWSWTVCVSSSSLVGPGWVMKWEDLLHCMTAVVSEDGDHDGDLNRWLKEENATSEKLLTAFMEELELPGGLEATSGELSEASSSKWSVHWP